MPTPSLDTDKAAVSQAEQAAIALAEKAVVALASEVGLGFSPGKKTQPQTGALAPEVCLLVPCKTVTRSHPHKLLLSFALTATLITSCDPPKPVPKTTTNNLQLTTHN
jgi:hypothetical protein